MRVACAWVVALITITAVLSGCHGRDRTPEIAAALAQILAAEPGPSITRNVWADVREFYKQRGGTPVWITSEDTSRGREVLQVLRTAGAHGLTPSDYDEPQIAGLLDALEPPDEDPATYARQAAEVDAVLTAALLTLGRDVALGRTRPELISHQWKARRAPPDFPATLARSSENEISGWLDAIRPQHPEYAALQRVLLALHAQRGAGPWPQVPAKALAPGQIDPAVIALRQRLAGTDRVNDAPERASPVYDADVEALVRAFQSLHGLKETGIADAATLAVMNVPVDERIAQVELNLERWRWMPDDFGPRHLIVNIPNYHLVAREDGKTVLDMRVVVGSVDNRTPVFSGDMTTVVFSPYWNVPESIVTGETVPAIARDDEYLARNNIDILRVSKSGTTRVDPSDIDWNDSEEIRGFAFRQRPGPGNALGLVKFLFPNEFSVYLHDTPADKLFARPRRALSHGCIRVEEPETLARYVLRDQTAWDEPRISRAMHAGVEKAVTLPATLPVHIVYFTAWVDDDGGLHFRHDIYGYDAQQT